MGLPAEGALQSEFPAAACCPGLDCVSSAGRMGDPGPFREPPVTGHSTEDLEMSIPTPMCPVLTGWRRSHLARVLEFLMNLKTSA